MMDKGVMGAVVQLNLSRPPGINKMSPAIEPEIARVLQEFADIFEEPKELPPLETMTMLYHSNLELSQ
jgi:hypothetical protein